MSGLDELVMNDQGPVWLTQLGWWCSQIGGDVAGPFRTYDEAAKVWEADIDWWES